MLLFNNIIFANDKHLIKKRSKLALFMVILASNVRQVIEHVKSKVDLYLCYMKRM